MTNFEHGTGSSHLMLLSGAMVLLNNITASGTIQGLTILVLLLTAVKLVIEIRKTRNSK